VKLLKRILLALLIVVAIFAILLVGSVSVDALVGSGRIAALSNTVIPGLETGTEANTERQPIAAYVARPPGAGPFPAVIMLHEFWGLKSEIAEKADALAAEGYVVVAPDMYRGQTTGWLPRAIYLALTIPEAQVLGDLDPVFRWLQEQPDVDPSRIVIMGFCYGGGKALQYSLVNDELAGTGVFYGALESDPAVLRRLPGPVLGVFGAEDRAPSPDQVAQFEAGLEAAGVDHEVTIYNGVGHAFVTDMAAIEQGGAPGQAWNQFVTWLERVVG
jgi:carboxymethylenebutenolidase